MRPCTRTAAAVIARGALAVILAVVVMGHAPSAQAIGTRKVDVILSDNTVYASSTYSIGIFQTSKKDPNIAGYSIVFPVGTDVTGASSAPGDVVTRDVAARSVTVAFGTPIDSQTEKTFVIVLDNVINPATPATTYGITGVSFRFVDGTTQTVSLVPNGTYTIVAAPYLSMTIATPDPGQAVEFGSIDPGVTTVVRNVDVTVTSTAPYTLTRTIVGGAALGLTPTGPAVRTGLAGSATFTDGFTLTPPWSTDPDVPLVATVTYTVLH